MMRMNPGHGEGDEEDGHGRRSPSTPRKWSSGTAEKDIVIVNPQVTRVSVMGQKTFQIMARRPRGEGEVQRGGREARHGQDGRVRGRREGCAGRGRRHSLSHTQAEEVSRGRAPDAGTISEGPRNSIEHQHLRTGYTYPLSPWVNTPLCASTSIASAVGPTEACSVLATYLGTTNSPPRSPPCR